MLYLLDTLFNHLNIPLISWEKEKRVDFIHDGFDISLIFSWLVLNQMMLNEFVRW